MRYDGLGWFGWIGSRLFNKVVIGSGQDCLEFGDLFFTCEHNYIVCCAC